jgi:hypothetical protein
MGAHRTSRRNIRNAYLGASREAGHGGASGEHSPAGAIGTLWVFGDPYELDGATVIPVARTAGGSHSGRGGGSGGTVRPLGALVVRGKRVRWQPIIDVNRAILGGQIVGAIFVVSAACVASRWLKHRA